MLQRGRQIVKGDIVLAIKGLRLDFHTYAGEVKALDGVDFEVRRGEALGLVGESGCGKSVTALTIARLLPEPAEIIAGEILLRGEDLLQKSKDEMREVRAKRIAMVFQDPMTYLNPVLTIGEQLTEVFLLDPKGLARQALEARLTELRKRQSTSNLDPDELNQLRAEIVRCEALLNGSLKLPKRELKKIAWQKSVEALRLVQMPDPERILKQYPHELSGGMRQRCMIAMALARNPDIFIADEITTALDVTIQAQILELLRELRDKIDASILVITHDLGVVAELCDRIAVMYAGNVVELAESHELFKNPQHPYTQGLLRAIPRIDRELDRLESIAGSVPDLIYPPSGCRFHPRCPYAFEKCKAVKPLLLQTTPDHAVVCHLYGGEKS